MTLPGDRIPEEALPEEGTSTPAADADMPPVWCRHSTRWSWVPDSGGYLCDDPQHYMGDPAVQSGAIPAEHQPHFAHPPNEAQLAALQVEAVHVEAERLQDRVRRITGR